MSILFVLIPLALVLLAIAIWAFSWAVNHGQFEDLDQAAASILFEEREPSASPPPPRRAPPSAPADGGAVEEPTHRPRRMVEED